jgi:hypothetical protein
MGNTSTYNREYYLKNRERINENAKRRRENMTAEEREKYLNRMKECYRKHHGYYVSRKQLLEENKKLKETIKDHQLYEEKLEHRIVEFEELLH